MYQVTRYVRAGNGRRDQLQGDARHQRQFKSRLSEGLAVLAYRRHHERRADPGLVAVDEAVAVDRWRRYRVLRSEEHTSELQSLMRISYAVFCLKKKLQ